ncbi:MAG: winged helix-turn-helix domain-containing tetratricopeptide repeat protein [Aestuariivirga sp.]
MRGVLHRGNAPVFLRPKAMALIAHLARNRGRVVPKSELMDAVWPDIHVTEDSLTQAVREIRKALGDENSDLLRTVSRRGYMLDQPAETGAEVGSLPIVAVLRFANETGDTAQVPLVDGFAEEIINGLSRFGTVTVMARASSFALPFGTSADWAQARSKIGADFLVEGSVRQAGGRIRVSVNLIDAATLVQIWGERYVAESGDIFSIQQDIVERIIGRLALRLDDAAVARASRKPAAGLDAYELLLRGVALFRKSPSYFKEAKELLQTAVDKDPNSGLARAQLAFVSVMVAGFGRAKRKDLDDALTVAAQAAIQSPDQSTVHRVLSFVQMYRREYAAAEHHLRRALELNPFDAEAIEQMGYLITLRGRPLEAFAWFDKAVRLNPIHPEWYDHDRAFAYYVLGEYRAAADAIERTPVPPPWMTTWLAACYAQMGDLETARKLAARINDQDPEFSALEFARGNGAAFEHDADNKHFAEGVYLALGVTGV